MNSGVYIIKNIVSGKMYVGSSSDLTRRKKDHFVGLRRGTHFNIHMLSSSKIYGAESFIFGVAEYCKEEDLLSKEQYYIDKYWHTSLYNARKTAMLRRPSDEERELQSKLKESKKRPLLQYDISGDFIKEWESCLSACKIYGNGVRSCLKGTLISCKNYIFFYKKLF